MKRWLRPRCGPCVDGLHVDCFVLLQMGVDRRGRPEKPTYSWPYKSPLKPGLYLWRCGCECETATGSKCLVCGRVGVVVNVSDSTSRCVDQVSCFEFRSRERKLSDPERTIAS